jgi:superfamily II DNA or RNA helicase
MADTAQDVTTNAPDAIVWDDVQEQAIDSCCDLTKRIVAVTGKAGTGKTMLCASKRIVHKAGTKTMLLSEAGYSGASLSTNWQSSQAHP